MEPKLQRRIQRYGWDKAAAAYDRYWGRQIGPAHRLLFEAAALRPGERVLDVACGTGLVSFAAAEAVGNRGSVSGTDISEEMVESVRREAARRGLERTEFRRMDDSELAFVDGSFDAVLCALGLMYFPDPALALREMKRVLAPGGRAAAVVWGERSRCGWAEIFPIVDSRVRSDVCPLFFRLGTGGSLVDEMKEAGFASVGALRLATTLHYETEEDACGAAFEGGPVALAYSRFGEKIRREARLEYIESIRPYKNGSGYRIPGEFVVACGTKEQNDV